ncbi:MAG: ABC transporter ATP-binding protein [Parcubacteria group bacterium]|jgi:ABC-type multidrug transport system fused ATPase/permease subunit
MAEKKDNLKAEKSGVNIRDFWLHLWTLIVPFHGQIFGVLVLIIFAEIVKLSGPYFLKLIIDNLMAFDATRIKEILIFIALMFASNEAGSLLSYVIDGKMFQILGGINEYIPHQALQKLLSLPLGYHEKENTGNKVVKITRGVDKIDSLLGNLSWEVVPTIFQIIFTAAVLLFLDWRFFLILLFFIPIFVFLTLKVNKEVYPYRRKRFMSQDESAGVMAQAIININTVKSFVQEKKESTKFQKIISQVKDNIWLEFSRIIKYNVKRNFVIDVGRAFILVAGFFLVWKNSMSIGSLVFVYTISEKALLSLFRISRIYDRVMESSEAIERIYSLSLEESEIKNAKNGFKPKNIDGQIEFKNVTFSYSDSTQKALNKVNFSINAGCMTALVGPSGGGKTTVARMVYRHYDPTKGDVLLDGKKLQEYDLYAFRKFIAIVPQEVEIFNTSVKDNIAYAKSNASFQEVQAAARIANAEEFITQLKGGYETLVGERGIKLSGGQRQRIGIARAILANPRILIFDEATSSLDSYSEKLIQEAMDKIVKGRTVIVIAHRLSTIKKADKIVVLEKGKVIEEGSHFELAQVSGGLYQKLIKLQEVGDVD